MTGPTTSTSQPDPALAPRTEGEGRFRLPLGAARLLLLGTWFLAGVLHVLLPPAGRVQVWPLSYLALEALACLSLAFRARRTPGEGRLAWWLLAASAFLEVPNLLLSFLQMQGFLAPWIPGTISLLSLSTGVLVLLGVLSFPKGHEGGGTLRRRALDSLIFAVSLLFLIWVMGMQGSLRTAAEGVLIRVFVSYLNVALLGGGLVFMTSYQPDRVRGPLGWLGASAFVWLAAISCWTLSGLPSVLATRWWIIMVGGIPVFQGLAAWSPRSVEEVMTLREDAERSLARLLPYLPVTVAVVVLAVGLLWAPLSLTREVFAIFLVMVVLLLLRQVQAIEDLQAARRTLEDRVRHRTKALEQAQDTLLRTERMNTAALMGAGLAHDLNNLLCAMKGSAELAAMSLEAGRPPELKDLQRIAKTADNAALLTRGLMGYVRREAQDLTPMDLGRDVREQESTLRLLLPRSVDLRIDVAETPGLFVTSSKLQLEQMLVNLVANAVDAMPAGGQLNVRVYPAQPDHVVLEVQDTGTGMGPETLERIFEPFYTTKPPGRGTGLGLPSLKAMIEEGGGRMEVESRLGLGSLFRILLPRVVPEGLSPR